MQLKSKSWNPATLCAGFITLILLTATTPQMWLLISPYLQKKLDKEFKNKQCMSFVQGMGEQRFTRARAELLAIAKWSEKAVEHGSLYSLWNNAEAKKMRCNKLKGSPVFYCAAKARPCKNLKPGLNRHAQYLK